MPIAITALFGLLLGSFLNVVAHRLPRKESLATPGSHCPGCDTPIRPYDNVPVLSWLMLRGRCRSCREPIAWRYPAVELTTALIDLDHRIIPNRITLPAAVAAIAITALTQPGQLPEHLIAGISAGGFLLLAALAYPRGMGMGDVKLAFVLGLFLGRDVGPAMLIALLTGTVVGVAIIAIKGAAEGRKTKVPFGPFLAIGGVAGLLAGAPIVTWYLHTFT